MIISPYFDRSEFACKCGCGFATVDIELLRVLEEIRWNFGRPVIISSGCRCISHNMLIGGHTRSKHVQGIAADIIVQGTPSRIVRDHLYTRYYNQYGIGAYDTFTHIDVRDKEARWTDPQSGNKSPTDVSSQNGRSAGPKVT